MWKVLNLASPAERDSPCKPGTRSPPWRASGSVDEPGNCGAMLSDDPDMALVQLQLWRFELFHQLVIVSGDNDRGP